jgi:putative DNA methylase
MGSKYKRKLIEVAIPLEDINKQAAREKSIRHGHPSTLHLWWARRPLAACRAVLFSQLVDDPSAHPEDFPTEEAEAEERERLFGIMRRLVEWGNSQDEGLLAEARAEIWKSCAEHPPPILDPFAGGGSIPLETLRLGLEAHASDLNPVAVLINKALIEIPPKWAGRPPVHPQAETRMYWPGTEGLAEDVRRYGQWIRDEAEKRIGHLYPKAKLDDGTLATVIAWIWARTVTCPNPACGGTMPLVRSFWLGSKNGKERYVHALPEGKHVRFEIRGPSGTPRGRTVSKNGAECLLCGASVPLAHVRAEGKLGRMGTQLMAIVAEGNRERRYLPPDDEHENIADVPVPQGAPDELLVDDPRNIWVVKYGMTRHADLYTNRQLTTLIAVTDLVGESRRRVLVDGAEPGYADAVATYLALVASRILDRNSSACCWDAHPSKEQVRGVFARQAIAMTWDFAEGNPFSASSGNLAESIEWVWKALIRLPIGCGTVTQADAVNINLEKRLVVATDPPYYDNVSYANLSDFFYVWLRRSLGTVYPDLMATMLTPKEGEIIADPIRHGGVEKAKQFFEERFEEVFTKIRESTPEGYPISFFYAYKQTEIDNAGGHASTGWEKLLAGMLRSGWCVTGTWPMRTEMGNRTRSLHSNALASSVVLACRPRPYDAEIIDRRGFLAALRAELPGRLRQLQQGNIAPVDLAQAAIGPGMAVFSRHRQVSEADGEPMSVRTALVLINQVLDEVLAEQEGDLDTGSRWCVKWFEEYEWTPVDYGRAETLATALNTSVPGLERAGVIKQPAGKVWLIRPEDLPAHYDLGADQRPIVWEAVMHLSKRLEERGIGAAGELMALIAPVVDLDAARELAYLLHNMSDRKRRTASAVRFNSLVTSWPDLAAAGLSHQMTVGRSQMTINGVE